jgi:hypothetical protein
VICEHTYLELLEKRRRRRKRRKKMRIFVRFETLLMYKHKEWDEIKHRRRENTTQNMKKLKEEE